MEKSCCANKAPTQNAFRDKLALYRPLVVIVFVSALCAAALSVQGNIPVMRGMMGMFLVFLAVLKLFDLQGFAAGFAGYDVLAAKVRVYALAYPFLELALGLLWLSGMFVRETSIATIAVMAISNIGVMKVMRSGQAVKCACVGTGFNLPVGCVTFAENTAMLAMAVVTLVQ